MREGVSGLFLSNMKGKITRKCVCVCCVCFTAILYYTILLYHTSFGYFFLKKKDLMSLKLFAKKKKRKEKRIHWTKLQSSPVQAQAR